MQVVIFLPSTFFFHIFLFFRSLFYHFLKNIFIYLDSGKAERNLKHWNKSVKSTDVMVGLEQGSYCTTISLKFSDLWPYYRAIEITRNLQRSWQCLISNSINSGILLCYGVCCNHFSPIYVFTAQISAPLSVTYFCASRCGTYVCAGVTC